MGKGLWIAAAIGGVVALVALVCCVVVWEDRKADAADVIAGIEEKRAQAAFNEPASLCRFGELINKLCPECNLFGVVIRPEGLAQCQDGHTYTFESFDLLQERVIIHHLGFKVTGPRALTEN